MRSMEIQCTEQEGEFFYIFQQTFADISSKIDCPSERLLLQKDVYDV